MKFEAALEKFMVEIKMEYGPDAELVKVGITPKLYNMVMMDLLKFKVSYSPTQISSLNRAKLLGVELVATDKDGF